MTGCANKDNESSTTDLIDNTSDNINSADDHFLVSLIPQEFYFNGERYVYHQGVEINENNITDFLGYFVNREDLEKWMEIDQKSDINYFIDENRRPLSMLELRDLFAHNKFVAFAKSTSRLTDLNRLRDKYLDKIAYIAKNSFYFIVGERQRFGNEGEFLYVTPSNFNVNQNTIINYDYIIADLGEEHESLKAEFVKRRNELLNSDEPLNHSSTILK